MITHSSAAKSTLATEIPNLVDGGTTNASGKIVYLTSGDVEVSSHTLSNPAFDGESGGSNNCTHQDAVSAAGGLIAKFELQDRDEVMVMTGTVTLSAGGGDIERSLLNITAGNTVKGGVFTYVAFP